MATLGTCLVVLGFAMLISLGFHDLWMSTNISLTGKIAASSLVITGLGFFLIILEVDVF